MSDATPHKIFLIPEVLEMILLQTEMRILLTSAQRVCCTWNELIKTSVDLQRALFFEPAKEKPVVAQKRTINALLSESIWPEFFRRRRTDAIISPKYFLPLDPVKEAAYTRPETSWRRMLLQQPPTYRMGIIETEVGDEFPSFSIVRIKMDDSRLRLGHINEKLETDAFLAGRDCLLLWERPNRLRQRERERQDARAMATSTYLNDCDVIIFCRRSFLLNDVRCRDRRNIAITPLDKWLHEAEKWRHSRSHYRLPIWNE